MIPAGPESSPLLFLTGARNAGLQTALSKCPWAVLPLLSFPRFTNPARGSRLGGVSFLCFPEDEAPAAKSPASAAGLLGGHRCYVTPRVSIMRDRRISFAPQKCTSRGGRLRTSHASVETMLPRPRYRRARSKGGGLASRQEGATAEKAVPFSKLRLSIVIQLRRAR